MTDNTVEGSAKATDKEVTVKVNGVSVTIEKKTTVGVLLDKAGYASATHYLVLLEHGKEVKEFRDVSADITLHEGEEFRAYYNSVTPLS